jgi:xanthine dehydrogenase/oxidase
MDRALMHADGVYKFPAQRVRGHMCRTNIASNTAFRGFGGPQVWAESLGYHYMG